MIYKVNVPDMMCERCVDRINSALTDTGISFSVDLQTKTVTVDGCEHCLNTALTELNDLGSTPKRI